jgi:hypothetical protein
VSPLNILYRIIAIIEKIIIIKNNNKIEKIITNIVAVDFETVLLFEKDKIKLINIFIAFLFNNMDIKRTK